ncbi:hypothetical protein CK203_103687 [Vitis vinifera]|uniref:Retrotransposon gag domain-containing protein n=1 Tax=Vitis vinifera TaxID=29760 RepID=A0A438DNE5_VITVI|nr:hypothetical protein CK203_103687 [Vitis vinifera]
MSQMEAMKRFMVMQPPSFNGEPSAEAAEHWLRRMRRILVGLDIPEEKGVYDTEVMTWEEFERIFLGKYFGEWLSMPRGWSLSTSSKEPCRLERKARRFQQGLRPAIRNRLVPLAIRDYSELVKRALLVEQDIEKPTKFRSKRGIEKGNKEWGKFPGISQQRQRTQQFERHSSFYAGGLAHCGHNRLDLSLREVLNNSVVSFQPLSFSCLTIRCHNYPQQRRERTTTMSSQTFFSGSNARGRGRQQQEEFLP